MAAPDIIFSLVHSNDKGFTIHEVKGVSLPTEIKLPDATTLLDLPSASPTPIPSVLGLGLFEPPITKVELKSVNVEVGPPVALEKIIAIEPPPPQVPQVKVSSPYAKPKLGPVRRSGGNGQVRALEPKDLRSNFGRRPRRDDYHYVPRIAPPKF